MIVPLPTPNYLHEQCAPNYIDRFESLRSIGEGIHIFDLTSKLLEMPLNGKPNNDDILKNKLYGKRKKNLNHIVMRDILRGM